MQSAVAVPSAAHTQVDSFFGSICESRHDQNRLSFGAPPSYEECPEYSLRAPEPVTLAMYLFKFGFLFPPFWILGVLILVSPLRAPPVDSTPAAWLPDKTDAERQIIIDRMRVAELKWARRCLFALLALIHLILAIVVGVVTWHALRGV